MQTVGVDQAAFFGAPLSFRPIDRQLLDKGFPLCCIYHMSNHETHVRMARLNKRSVSYAVCRCGWTGKHRTSTSTAMRDGSEHEESSSVPPSKPMPYPGVGILSGSKGDWI